MKLQRLVLTDIGVYRGRNEFDLGTDKGKPIVVFGGINGAGKTTLFESVLLCLYGRDAIEPRLTQKQYREKMRRLFHQYAKTSKRAEESSISLEFLYAREGKITSYRITRMWQNDGDVTESLYVYKKKDEDYIQLDSMERAQWQTFIDRLLPKSITKLFFFDGEKIHHMAEFGREDAHIKASFDALLGLDIVDQLHDDIGLYMLRNSDGETKQILADLESKDAEKKKSEAKIEEYQEKHAFLAGEIEGLRKQVAADEEKFLKLGGQFAKDRASLMEKKAVLESKVEGVKREIQGACSDVLPLCLVPAQLNEVRKDLERDRLRVENHTKREILDSAYHRFGEAVESRISKYDDRIRGEISADLKTAMAELLESMPAEEKTAFNLSLEDTKEMMGMIDAVSKYNQKKIKNLTEEYDKLQDELGQIKSSLEVAPSQDEIGPVFSKITQANRQMGEMNGELERLADLAAQEKSMIVMLNAQIRQNLARRKIDKRKMAGLEMAPAVQDVLKDYAQKLRLQKVKLLESNILDCMHRLFHKEGLAESVDIDPETFQITMYGAGDEPVTRERMSKGELQTYATAIVWGLAKTSGRPLPFMIDTPLARLDMEHRANILDRFYPHASHQTVIFSTDSEIYGPYHDQIAPHMTRSMLVTYDAQEGRSVQSEGHFKEVLKHKVQ